MSNQDTDSQNLTAAQQAAQAALSAANNDAGSGDEQAASDDFAKTLNSLQALIESKANKLMDLKQAVSQKREMMNSVYENDQQLKETQDQKEAINQNYKERHQQLTQDPAVRQAKEDLARLKQEQKELEESLSTHLISYHQLTNSTSFDTSDGDQWEFDIHAKVKSRSAGK